MNFVVTYKPRFSSILYGSNGRQNHASWRDALAELLRCECWAKYCRGTLNFVITMTPAAFMLT